jgi:hypothetical protein
MLRHARDQCLTALTVQQVLQRLFSGYFAIGRASFDHQIGKLIDKVARLTVAVAVLAVATVVAIKAIIVGITVKAIIVGIGFRFIINVGLVGFEDAFIALLQVAMLGDVIAHPLIILR